MCLRRIISFIIFYIFLLLPVNFSFINEYPEEYQISVNTSLRMILETKLVFDKDQMYQNFTARLSEPLIFNDKIILPEGTKISGYLKGTIKYTKSGENYIFIFIFDNIILDNGGKIPFECELNPRRIYTKSTPSKNGNKSADKDISELVSSINTIAKPSSNNYFEPTGKGSISRNNLSDEDMNKIIKNIGTAIENRPSKKDDNIKDPAAGLKTNIGRMHIVSFEENQIIKPETQVTIILEKAVIIPKKSLSDH